MSAECEAANSIPEIGSSQPIASQLMNSSDLDYGDDESARKKRRIGGRRATARRGKMSREVLVSDVVQYFIDSFYHLSKTFYPRVTPTQTDHIYTA